MFKKLLVGLLSVVMIGCLGVGVSETLTQKNGCAYPEMYTYENEIITEATEDYYLWNGMQILVEEAAQGFTFIIMDYDAPGVIFGYDADGDCVVDRCVAIAVTDIEDIKTSTDPNDITVTWVGEVSCDGIAEFIEENLVE